MLFRSELPGVPLGSFAGVEYDELTFALHAGDVFVFCTDGVFEARGADGSDFGSERLRAVVSEHAHEPARQIVDAIFDAVEQFREGRRQDDDITAVVRGMWDNLGRVMAEYAHLDRFHWSGNAPRVELTGTEHLDAAKASGKPVLLISAHFANWEIMQFVLHDYGFQGAPKIGRAHV